MNEFAVAFKGVLSTDEGDGPDALRRLFARIDANADGTVDWREFSTYILLENDSAARYLSVHITDRSSPESLQTQSAMQPCSLDHAVYVSGRNQQHMATPQSQKTPQAKTGIVT